MLSWDDSNNGANIDPLTLQGYRPLVKNAYLFEFPALVAARQTEQPMHSQSAKTEYSHTEFTQLGSHSFAFALR